MKSCQTSNKGTLERNEGIETIKAQAWVKEDRGQTKKIVTGV